MVFRPMARMKGKHRSTTSAQGVPSSRQRPLFKLAWERVISSTVCFTPLHGRQESTRAPTASFLKLGSIAQTRCNLLENAGNVSRDGTGRAKDLPERPPSDG